MTYIIIEEEELQVVDMATNDCSLMHYSEHNSLSTERCEEGICREKRRLNTQRQ